MSAAALCATSAYAEDTFTYRPTIHGTLRAKFEHSTAIGKSRFEVRNARVSVDGKVLPIVSYRAEVDLCDEGVIKMLDAYIRVQPWTPVQFTVGQMRVPFTIDAHRAPHAQYFANRSFLAKQVGNVRDVGAMVGYTFAGSCPVTLQAGAFNGSGLTKQKNYWTSGLNYSLKAQTMIAGHVNVTLSCQKATAGETNVYMYDAGSYYQSERWHFEAEYLRKHYQGDAFKAVNCVDAFAVYRLPVSKTLNAISFLGRYDYMSDHSNGAVDDNGTLALTDPERHRVTGGITLSSGTKGLQADVRINYEQYFYGKDAVPGISDRNKIVVEFVCRF